MGLFVVFTLSLLILIPVLVAVGGCVSVGNRVSGMEGEMGPVDDTHRPNVGNGNNVDGATSPSNDSNGISGIGGSNGSDGAVVNRGRGRGRDGKLRTESAGFTRVMSPTRTLRRSERLRAKYNAKYDTHVHGDKGDALGSDSKGPRGSEPDKTKCDTPVPTKSEKKVVDQNALNTEVPGPASNGDFPNNIPPTNWPPKANSATHLRLT